MKNLNIGLVGYGFMGRTHSNAFHQAPRFFDLPFRPVLKAICARDADRAKRFASNWGYEGGRERLAEARRAEGHRPDRHRQPNDTHHEIAIAAAQAGKIVMCEKPLGRNAKEAEAMVAAVESAGVANTVWYNYRRVPAVTMLKQLLDEGTSGSHLPLPREVPAGLDDLAGPAAGRRRAVAARCEGRRQRRHGRSARALHRHGAVAERLDHRGHGDDGDLHQGAEAQPHGQGRARRDRRCQRGADAIRERIAGDVRGDALRPRPQGALHARDQRRARLSVLGPPRSASHSVLRSSRRGTACAAGATSTSPTATSPT